MDFVHLQDSFDYASNFFENKCAEWAAEEAANPAPIDTIPCPCTTTQMEQDNDFQEGIALVASIFHTGAATCSRSIEPRYVTIIKSKLKNLENIYIVNF